MIIIKYNNSKIEISRTYILDSYTLSNRKQKSIELMLIIQAYVMLTKLIKS